VLAADTHLETCLCRTAFLCTHFYELSYTFLVEHLEWICLDDTQFLVVFEELRSVVARVSECHLSQVVCSEREEVGIFGNLVGNESGARHLNHCTNLVSH